VNAEQLGTVLSVWAHPDDEAYLSGATMAACVRGGQRVVCVTATRGEGGSQDHDRWPPEKMAEIREVELARCLETLGVSEHHWLDYVDGTCHEVDPDEAVGKVRALLDEIQPDTVLTFGPDGMTGHQDHQAVSRWTTAAFAEAAKPGARLLYATQTPEWAAEFLPLLEPFNVFTTEPPITPQDQLVFTYLAEGEHLEQKVRALLAQESQVEGIYRHAGHEAYAHSVAAEYFRSGP